MAKKSVMKSIRLSEDLLAYIEKQSGNGFSDKFENLIISARDDESRLKKELKRLNDLVDNRRKQLDEISAQVSALDINLQEIFRLDLKISSIKGRLDAIDDS